MKTYIIGNISFPYGMATTNRVRCYAEGLNNNKTECEVIVTVATENPNTTIFNLNPNGKFRNTKFRYLSNTTIRNKTFLGRRVQDSASYIRLFKFILSELNRNDVVLIYDCPNELFVVLACKLVGAKVYRELCEYPYATVNDSLYNRFRRSFFLKSILPLYSGFIVISEELKKIAIKYGSRKSRVIKVPILIDKTSKSLLAYRQDKPYIFHSGTMNERKDAIVSTFKAFAIASQKLHYRVDFLLAGPTSPQQNELDEIIQNSHLEKNVKFLGSLKKEEVDFYQNGASLAILNKNDNLQNRCGFSTKLGELLLSGTPVITTTVGEANYWLKDGISAYITEPHNPEAIANQIIRAFSDENERSRIAINGQQIAELNFDCNIQGKRLANFFKGLDVEDMSL